MNCPQIKDLRKYSPSLKLTMTIFMAKRNRKISFSRSDPSLLQSRCASSSVPLRPPKNYLYAINISQKYAAVSALLATRQKNWTKKWKSRLKCRIFRNSMNLSLFMSYSLHKLFLQNFHIFICICITWIIICLGTFGAFNSTARDTKLWIIFWRFKCRWTAQYAERASAEQLLGL